jgi:uncharacterized membrane protein YeaQ/YmgE (transglycosylase-associated protein family)
MDVLVGGTIGLLLVSVVGLLIGVVAKLLLPGRDPGGWIVTILLGIAGSWVGHFVFGRLGGGTGSGTGAFLSAVGGAMLLLIAYRVIKRA